MTTTVHGCKCAVFGLLMVGVLYCHQWGNIENVGSSLLVNFWCICEDSYWWKVVHENLKCCEKLDLCPGK